MRKLIAPLALACCLPILGQEPPKAVPAGSELARAPTELPTPRIPRAALWQRFWLFPELAPAPPPALELPAADQVNKRLFHQIGDPDSLFTFGGATPEGELRLKAAVELNDIILKALPPDLHVDPTDTRFRSAGSFSALDAHGRPYQLRLGARLVW
jgi:hypothetical protein